MNKQKQLKQKQYKEMVDRVTPASEIPMAMFKAFLVGGLICVIGQVLLELFKGPLAMEGEDAASMTSMVLIFLGATLTGLGVYDKIGKFAGAGSIVPITGFANSIVAPAMEFKREGYVMGVGAKMFILAGPVIVYGVLSSVVVGVLYFIVEVIRA